MLVRLAGFKPDFERFRGQFTSQPAKEDNRPVVEAQIAKWLIDLQELTREIADATLYLPAFDVRQANSVRFHALPGRSPHSQCCVLLSQTVAALKLSVECLRTEILPRKKFRFTDRDRLKKAQAAGGGSGGADGSASMPADSVAAVVKRPDAEDASEDEYSIRSLTGETITVLTGQLREGQDIRLEDLTNCTIIMCVESYLWCCCVNAVLDVET